MSKPFNEFGPFAAGETVQCHSLVVDTHLNGTWIVILENGEHAATDRLGNRHSDWYVVQFPHEDHVSRVRRINLRRRPPADYHERLHMQLWRDMAGKAPQRQGEMA